MSNKTDTKRSNFSGKLGYVLAVAGSAVGLGNIWRFPYLAAKYGGGMFLLVYLILMLTFGYAMIVSETALGRRTGRGPIGAFRAFGTKLRYKFGGWINAIIPMLILPYYCTLGGWVIKYLVEYCKGSTAAMAEDTYFTGFIGSAAQTEIYFLIFAVATVAVVIFGVQKGVERVSKIMMPALIVLAVIVAIYSMSLPGAFEGVKYFLVPNFKNFSIMTVVAALGQMFYSLSIAMGILYTYGSYLKRDVDIEKTTTQIEIFDTSIAILAGLMIIPAVFAFSGGNPDALNAGPSLMFVTIPKVFETMGFGTAAGIVFFLLVFFAALTSSISLAETTVSTFQDELGWGRVKSTIATTVILVGLGTVTTLGFNVLDFIKILGMGALDFFDFVTNSVMMPISALCTCLLIVYSAGLKTVGDEVKLSSKFKREKLYNFFMKYLAPICMIIILLSSVANVFGWIKM